MLLKPGIYSDSMHIDLVEVKRGVKMTIKHVYEKAFAPAFEPIYTADINYRSNDICNPVCWGPPCGSACDQPTGFIRNRK